MLTLSEADYQKIDETIEGFVPNKQAQILRTLENRGVSLPFVTGVLNMLDSSVTYSHEFAALVMHNTPELNLLREQLARQVIHALGTLVSGQDTADMWSLITYTCNRALEKNAMKTLKNLEPDDDDPNPFEQKRSRLIVRAKNLLGEIGYGEAPKDFNLSTLDRFPLLLSVSNDVKRTLAYGWVLCKSRRNEEPYSLLDLLIESHGLLQTLEALCSNRGQNRYHDMTARVMMSRLQDITKKLS